MEAWEQALDLRTELLQWWANPSSGQIFSLSWSLARAEALRKGREIGLIEIDKLNWAAPFYVTHEMTSVVEKAAETLPDTILHATDLPAAVGFGLFARPITFPDVNGVQQFISAFTWGTAVAPDDLDTATGIHLSLYAHGDYDPTHQEMQRQAHAQGQQGFPTLSLVHETPWHFDSEYQGRPDRWAPGMAGSEDQEITAEMLAGGEHIMRVIHTFFLMVQQEIGNPTRYQASRGPRKRAMKLNPHREIPDVRVITLRRLRSGAEKAEPLGDSIEWTHRWLVNGHWRRQWYATEGRHKPKWIAPYIKGPEDKPFQAKDTAYVWRR